MGALISGPTAAVGSCAASMCGGCMAAGCCKLASAGSTETTKAARCVLLWLQVIAASVGTLMASNPKSWLDWPCSHLPYDFGICECTSEADEVGCYGNQLIYRSEACAVLVFMLLLILCVSGCAKHAAKDCPFGKFLGLLGLIAVSLFLPNSAFASFGSIAGVGSAAYLVAQTILLMDFGYAWNETWHQNALASQRELNPSGHKRWLVAIVVSAALLALLSVTELITLMSWFDNAGARVLLVFTFLTGVALLIVSITDWCEHGNLLTSCVVLAYMMWLGYEALSMLSVEKGGIEHLLSRWIGLAICTLSLTAFAYSTSFGGKTTEPQQQALAEQGQAGVTSEAAAADQDDTPAGLDTSDFTVQCAVHACAAVYITSSLAPSRGDWSYGARVTAVILSLALYGWTLVAPKVLTNRQF